MNRKVNEDKLLPPKMEQIYFFAEKGDAKSLLECLRTGGTINFVHPTSTDSPLMVACRRGYTEVVRICLDYGAKNDPHPDFGQTALHAAVASGRQACAAIILEVAQESEADSIISNLTDQYGQTPLHTACIIGSVPVAELLLHHGARTSSIDTYGQTPLHLCAGSGHKNVLAILLDHEGDVLIDLPDVYGNSPLHHAAYHGKLECAKLLLETAANVNARNNEGLTAYNLAIIHGHHQISAVILEYRSDGGGGGDRFSRESTPYYSDSPYGTPMAIRAVDIPTPNLRRAQTYGGAESSSMYDQLPRPHT
ncbi:ankyrin repeat domain-containing protein, partial [archaeon]